MKGEIFLLNIKGKTVPAVFHKPKWLMNALENGNIVEYQGRGTGSPIYEFTYNGERHNIAITVGNNEFVVGANPK